MFDIALALIAAATIPQAFDRAESSPPPADTRQSASASSAGSASERQNASASGEASGSQSEPFAPLPPQMSLEWPVDFDRAAIGDREIGVVALQALLDRSAHSPGVVDGLMGGNTARAIHAYRHAHGLSGNQEPDRALWQSLLDSQGGEPIFTTYTITGDDVDGPFYDVPSDFAAKSRLDHLGYESVVEMLAERFHMDEDFLRFLNPGASWSAGERINVIDQPSTPIETDVRRIVVDKGAGAVRAYDGEGTLLATYPATIGSTTFPSPEGTMEVLAVAPEPNYFFDPEGREWGPERELRIAPGPNNPVGGTWIDLSKPGYGIHGSPDPQLIGKTSSHGCVRLTNWDAEQLAEATAKGATVTFT